ncbi:hypothetical protein Leryth_020424 [Lithospermum erythrorhizon]|nr:hypothetical protein Leryth_020424 [Lithospermum erythrorhizon]
MENGEGGEDGTFMETKMASLALSDSNNNDNNNSDGLFQVIKAVEAAEATIKQQVEENNWLRAELEEKIQQLDKYKSGYLKAHSPQSVDPFDNLSYEPQRQMESDNQTDRASLPGNIHEHQFSNSIVPKENMTPTDEYHTVQDHVRTSASSNRVSSPLRILPAGLAASDFSASSQLFSPLAESLTPFRYRVDGESNRQLSISGAGIVPISEINSKNLKQDLGLKIHEHEEEISLLKKHLAEYSVNEAKILNEKHNLEKRISHMRMAFDQQQQDLVDAASRAISYRQDIIEENIRLAYALQAAQQERSTFISSLMPLLAEYSLDPPVADAQSVVSNVKVLFRHLHEKLVLTEAKLKESQYQISPWHSDRASSNVAQSHYLGTNDGLELVPQPQYHDGNRPASPVPLETTDWDLLGHRESEYSVGAVRTSEPDDPGKQSPLVNRNTATQEVPGYHNVTREDFHVASNHEETTSKRVTFGNLVRNSQVDDSDMERHQNDTEPSASWAPNNSAYTTAEEPSSSYPPYLPVVPEERSSSVSEEDGPLPAIEGLQISGEALPGRELQASGYSINGTTSCNFEWVRHMEDGSFNYIEGAKQPHYLVTADDVDTFLAIEVQPLDNRKRKGELVTVFANDHNKILCDLEMQNCIKRTYDNGHASYSVSMSIGYIDMWEPATLSIKKNSYSIKSNGSSGVVVSEKYSQSIIVSIPFGSLMEFSIMDSRGEERLLRADSTETNFCRDTIVLTLRLFILRANAKKKSKRGLFFTK